MFAAMKGDIERVRWLLARGAPLELADKDGKTALIYAASYHRIDGLRLLISAGANVNAIAFHGITAIHLVCDQAAVHLTAEYFAIIDVLVAAGADVNAKSVSRTSLHTAAVQGAVDVIKKLLSAGADATLLNLAGKTAQQLLFDHDPDLEWPAPAPPP
jgi:ankyrin repeat protein